MLRSKTRPSAPNSKPQNVKNEISENHMHRSPKELPSTIFNQITKSKSPIETFSSPDDFNNLLALYTWNRRTWIRAFAVLGNKCPVLASHWLYNVNETSGIIDFCVVKCILSKHLSMEDTVWHKLFRNILEGNVPMYRIKW